MPVPVPGVTTSATLALRDLFEVLCLLRGSKIRSLIIYRYRYYILRTIIIHHFVFFLKGKGQTSNFAIIKSKIRDKNMAF